MRLRLVRHVGEAIGNVRLVVPCDESEGDALLTQPVGHGIGCLLIQLDVDQRYVEAVGRLAANPNGRTLVVPIETAGLAGSITQAVAAMQFAQAGTEPGPARPPG